jgi:hypothetical protein
MARIVQPMIFRVVVGSAAFISQAVALRHSTDADGRHFLVHHDAVSALDADGVNQG